MLIYAKADYAQAPTTVQLMQAPTELMVFDGRLCFCVQEGRHLTLTKLTGDFTRTTLRANRQMRNLLWGTDFVLYNDPDYRILSWHISALEQNSDAWLEGDSEVEGQRNDILVQRLSTAENLFLAFNEETQRFKTFTSNGRERLMDQVREIYFGPGMDFIGLHAYSALIFCGLHPLWASSAEKHFLVTVDVKHVRASQATGAVSSDRMQALS